MDACLYSLHGVQERVRIPLAAVSTHLPGIPPTSTPAAPSLFRHLHFACAATGRPVAIRVLVQVRWRCTTPTDALAWRARANAASSFPLCQRRSAFGILPVPPEQTLQHAPRLHAYTLANEILTGSSSRIFRIAPTQHTFQLCCRPSYADCSRPFAETLRRHATLRGEFWCETLTYYFQNTFPPTTIPTHRASRAKSQTQPRRTLNVSCLFGFSV